MSTSELPGSTDTAARIRGYIQQFAAFLGTKEISGGILAIATDTREAAETWGTFLDQCVGEIGITDDQGSSGPFKIADVGPATFIVWW